MFYGDTIGAMSSKPAQRLPWRIIYLKRKCSLLADPAFRSLEYHGGFIEIVAAFAVLINIVHFSITDHTFTKVSIFEAQICVGTMGLCLPLANAQGHMRFSAINFKTVNSSYLAPKLG